MRPSFRSTSVILAVVALGFACMLAAQAPEQPSKAFLRIETGMHTGTIWRIDTDAAGRFIVTASDDKTARVWDAANGNLLRVLRPPQGEGNVGRLNAVAITPDGTTVAVGGTVGASQSDNRIYLFNRATGNQQLPIGGSMNAVFHLCYSPDGRYLAAAMSRGSGIRIYRTSDRQEVARDTDYGNAAFWADFDRSGRLVTSSWDGFVRLYDSEFRLVTKRQAPGGKEPFSVRFSPDGSKIAVGFGDTTAINVLSGQDLSLLYAPDTRGGDKGTLNATAWSADGRILYGGGGYRASDVRMVLAWTDGGRGSVRVWRAATDNVLNLRALPGGGLAFCAGGPKLAVLDSEGRILWQRSPEVLDYLGKEANLRLARDGSVVEFGFRTVTPQWSVNQRLARFSIDNRALSLDPSHNSSLYDPRTDGLAVADWRDSLKPTLNGVALPLRENERSRCLAISPDASRFVLGTSSMLHLFDRQGQVKWSVSVPGEAREVNLTPDSRYAVAALQDGTVRWYETAKGREVLALFVDSDGRRWVIWTPNGYYDASPGGEDLIGWHVNNGPDQAADFYPASRFRSTKYRPDVVSKVLSTMDEAEAVRLADAERGKASETASIAQALPPAVTLTSPQDGSQVSSTTVTLHYAVSTPSGEPVTAIRALVDGRPAVNDRNVKPAAQGEERTITVTIPERDCQVSLIAENRFSASVPATVHLNWASGNRGVRVAVPTAEAEFVAKPKLYLLAVGESAYQKPELKLGFAAKDARDFAAAMETQKGKLYAMWK